MPEIKTEIDTPSDAYEGPPQKKVCKNIDPRIAQTKRMQSPKKPMEPQGPDVGKVKVQVLSKLLNPSGIAVVDECMGELFGTLSRLSQDQLEAVSLVIEKHGDDLVIAVPIFRGLMKVL